MNSDQDREAIKKTVKKEELTWRSWWDARIDGPIHTAWQIKQRPAIHILDQEGVIRFKDIPPDEIDEAIDSLLGG